MKKAKELDEAIACLSRMLHSGESELIHDRRLHRARRELNEYRKGGRQPERRLQLAVKLLAELAADAFLTRERSNDE